MNRHQKNVAMLSLAERARDEVSAWEAKLEALYADLEALDSGLAEKALMAFGDRALSVALLCGALPALGGKSAMQIALETGGDPFEALLQCMGPSTRRLTLDVRSQTDSSATAPIIEGQEKL